VDYLGQPYPVYADGKAWLWLGLSALVGYVFGDWCLFNSYLAIGARFGQLFMTLAPPMAAIAGWAMLGELDLEVQSSLWSSPSAVSPFPS
jgi:EamA-like transporter family.